MFMAGVFCVCLRKRKGEIERDKMYYWEHWIDIFEGHLPYFHMHCGDEPTINRLVTGGDAPHTYPHKLLCVNYLMHNNSVTVELNESVARFDFTHFKMHGFI